MHLSILLTIIRSFQLFCAQASSLGHDNGTCTKEYGFGILYDFTKECRTVSEIEYTYCEGSCGNSLTKPIPFVSGRVDQDSYRVLDINRCCEALVKTIKAVNVTCQGSYIGFSWLYPIANVDCAKRTCTKEHGFGILYDTENECRTASEMYTCCAGFCANSTTKPLPFASMVLNNDDNERVLNTNRCCQAVVKEYKDVNMICLSDEMSTWNLAVISDCQCRLCYPYPVFRIA